MCLKSYRKYKLKYLPDNCLRHDNNQENITYSTVHFDNDEFFDVDIVIEKNNIDDYVYIFYKCGCEFKILPDYCGEEIKVEGILQ